MDSWINGLRAAGATWGLSLEQKLPTSTYLGVEADLLEQKVSPVAGDFEFLDDSSDGSISGGSAPQPPLPPTGRNACAPVLRFAGQILSRVVCAAGRTGSLNRPLRGKKKK